MKEEYFSIVSEKFDYLCKDYEFIQASPYPYMVVYKTAKYTISIGYDYGRSFEIICTCSDDGINSYTLQEILRIKNKAKARNYAFFQTNNIEEISGILDYISNVFKNDILDILKESGIFLRLKKQQENDCKEYQLKSNYQDRKPVVEKAWKQKDYEVFVKLLEPFVEILSQTDKEKIKYANRQLDKS